MAHLETLVQKAAEGQLTLLLGTDLPQAITGLPPGRELAQGLADSESLAAATENLKRLGQQWRYTNHLKNALPPGGQPGPLHRAVAALPVPYLITTACDDRLARALGDVNLLILDDDLTGRDLEAPNLIKLCGDLSQLHTLAVAESDYADLMLDGDRREVLDLAAGWLREKSALLVGCDPSEQGDFENWLYWDVLKRLGAFGQESFMLWPDPAAGDVARWAARNVTLIDEEPLDFLQSLAQSLQGAEVSRPPDKELAALQGLLQMLRGSPTQEQVAAKAAAVPASQRLKSIRITFRFRLRLAEGGREVTSPLLRAAIDLKYDPDIDHYPGELKDTGVSLQQLRDWAAEAQEAREAWEMPQGGPVEQKGLAFFDAILPAGSSERRAYERALYLRQTFADALTIVIQLEDERGRLSPFPWELMHDGHVEMGRGFLGLEYPVYRRLRTVSSPGQVTGRIQKALIVAADPTQMLGGLDGEVDDLLEALQAAGVAQVDVRRPDHPDVGDPAAVKRLLRDGGYQLFHFAGHGVFDEANPSQSKLMLGLSRERGKALTASALADVAREGALVMVFLSACQVGQTEELPAARPWEEGGVVDALTRAGVPAAVGMRWILGNENGQKLVQTFYTELLAGKSVERALMLARKEVADEPDWANPILTKRHGVL
jgi:hypothetical protein